MKEAEYISKTDLGDAELEFENLRDAGIDEIQRLAGNQWTDYNVHDPGITILEQLCFAITELGYKTAFDIKDLLASQHVEPAISGTFFTAAQILEGKPVIITDFRKLLIDRVDGLRDVWIEPLNVNSDREQIKGLYMVLIRRSPVVITTEAQRTKLLSDTRSYLEKYSNLGEAFNDILILDEVEIKVSGEIELLKETNVDKTHAQILYNIQQYISSPIRFYSLDQMLESGYTMEEIFDGPRLYNGFIKEEDLKDRIKTLMTSHLVNIINEVDGVLKVRSLKIETLKGPDDEYATSVVDHLHLNEVAQNSQKVMDEGVLIDMNKVAVFAKMMIPYNPEAQQTFVYYQNNEKANLFKNNVVRYFRQIENDNKVKYSLDFQPTNDSVPQQGSYRPLDDYFSVQEHFPAIYALGTKGIPPYFEKARVNQVKQLKAYLLVFEQILTNYLAQLTNFSHLFSLDEKLAESYYAGSLDAIPYIRDLLVGLQADTSDARVAPYTREISQSALNSIDDFMARRHQVLDHLLARFGEQVSTFGIEKYNYYYDEDTLEKVKLSAKINYLKELIYLSSNKARSFNAEAEFWSGDNENKDLSKVLNISYLEKKVRIRLGMPMQNIQMTTYLRRNIASWKPNDVFSISKIVEQVSENNILRDTQLVLNTVADPTLLKEKFEPGIPIDSELLRRGIWADNYKLITYTNNEKINLVAFSRKFDQHSMPADMLNSLSEKLTHLGSGNPDFLRFWTEDNIGRRLLIEFEKEDAGRYNPVPRNVWVILKEFDTRAGAESYMQSMTNHLAYFNINTEGFYLVDHIELRPRREKDLYGLILKDRANRTGLISEKQYPYADVQEAFINLVLNAREATYIHKNTADGQIETKLVYNGNIIGTYMYLGTGLTPDTESRETALTSLFDSLNEFDLHDPAVIQFYSAKNMSSEIGEATFYSFRVSVIIPTWPSRFADPEFRKVIEAMIREEAPSHIGLDFYYLDFDKMSAFETIYSQWLKDFRQLTAKNTDQLNISSGSLSLFIKKMESTAVV